MSEIKKINIKNRTYYFFDNIDANQIKINKKSLSKISLFITLGILLSKILAM